jgi:predicted N-acyltransferase
MPLEILDSINRVAAADWDRLVGADYPFARHAFLRALEETGCVGESTGWRPRHLLWRGPDGRLAGASPCYLKSHSYGEYVFDWAWAEAYRRAGRSYYPKLVIAVPFTPATGPRLLLAPGADHDRVRYALIEGALALARAESASSVHWLFPTEDEARALEAAGMLRRRGVQFHWENRGWRDFEDFLAAFTAAKRKKIRQERRYVREAGVTMRILTGAEIDAAHWDAFYEFYTATIQAHGSIPYLTREFFHRLGEVMPEAVVLVLAARAGRYVGGALCLRGQRTLYGRYWGALEPIGGLHFETCYYTPLEYCLANGLARYEAGAQGEHKLARGFLPAETHSAHWLSEPAFRRAVADYLARERHVVEDYHRTLREAHAPFKRGAAAAAEAPPEPAAKTGRRRAETRGTNR